MIGNLFGSGGRAEEGGTLPPPPPPEDPPIIPGFDLGITISSAGGFGSPEEKKVVDAGGYIQMALIGAVKCDGLTLVQLQDKLVEAYKEYVLDPQVSVRFLYNGDIDKPSPWGTVLLEGQVVRPGPVNMPSTRDMTVSRALMLAGGATPMADKTKIRISRRSQDGRTVTQSYVNLEKIVKDGLPELDMILKPGDVIWVPESWY